MSVRVIQMFREVMRDVVGQVGVLCTAVAMKIENLAPESVLVKEDKKKNMFLLLYLLIVGNPN